MNFHIKLLLWRKFWLIWIWNLIKNIDTPYIYIAGSFFKYNESLQYLKSVTLHATFMSLKWCGKRKRYVSIHYYFIGHVIISFNLILFPPIYKTILYHGRQILDLNLIHWWNKEFERNYIEKITKLQSFFLE